VFAHHVARRGLDRVIRVDSAGTGDWHIGHAPDKRTAAAAILRGYDLSSLRARQVTREDFSRFDYILAMDAENLRNLQAMRPSNYCGELKLFLDYGDDSRYREVPDPYYGGADDFALVVDLVENAALRLLDHIVAHHRPG
jgi:protein-tyrosine phosphatase